MARSFVSLRSTAHSNGRLALAKPAAAAVRPSAVFRNTPPRNVLRRATPSEGEEIGTEINKDEKNEFDVPHTGRAAPMSEVKRSAAEQQGAAPEGDRAIQGQAWQPTGEAATSETPAERYGSDEAAAEAMEDAKDRSRKSELQTTDDTAQAPGGGMTGEGSSA